MYFCNSTTNYDSTEDYLHVLMLTATILTDVNALLPLVLLIDAKVTDSYGSLDVMAANIQ